MRFILLYSFYCPSDGGRLSWPRHCCKCAAHAQSIAVIFGETTEILQHGFDPAISRTTGKRAATRPLQRVRVRVWMVVGMSEVHQQQLGHPGSQHVKQVAGAACAVLRPSAEEELQEPGGGRAGGHTEPSGRCSWWCLFHYESGSIVLLVGDRLFGHYELQTAVSPTPYHTMACVCVGHRSRGGMLSLFLGGFSIIGLMWQRRFVTIKPCCCRRSLPAYRCPWPLWAEPCRVVGPALNTTTQRVYSELSHFPTRTHTRDHHRS